MKRIRLLQFSFICILGILFSISVSAQNCKYDPMGNKHVPCSFETVTYEGIKISRIAGKVFDGGETVVEGAVVSLHQVTKNGSKFIGSQLIGSNGKFCFNKMKTGKYLLKIGFRGFKCMHYELILSSANKQVRRNLIVNLEVGV